MCAGLDYAPLPQQMFGLLIRAIGADAMRSRAIGTSRKEQLGFVDYALGAVDSHLNPLPPPHRHVDIVLLVQNILLDGEPYLLGSDLVVQLRERGFAGVACLISGHSAEAAAQLRNLPGVDLTYPKDFEHIVLARKLRAAAIRKAAQAASAQGGAAQAVHQGGPRPATPALTQGEGAGRNPTTGPVPDPNPTPLRSKLGVASNLQPSTSPPLPLLPNTLTPETKQPGSGGERVLVDLSHMKILPHGAMCNIIEQVESV